MKYPEPNDPVEDVIEPSSTISPSGLNSVGDWLLSLPTGRKIFLAILLALAPLALITLIANIQSARTGDMDRTALIKTANLDIAQRIASSLVTDEQLVRRPLSQISFDEYDPIAMQSLCSDIQQALSASKSLYPHLHIFQPGTGRHMCHFGASAEDDALTKVPVRQSSTYIAPTLNAVVDVIDVTDKNGVTSTAALIYNNALLQDLAKPPVTLPRHNLHLRRGDDETALVEQIAIQMPGNILQASTPVGKSGLILDISTTRRSLSRDDIISFIVPVAMWLLAAALAWVLLNQLMLRPLREIQSNVARYRPGQRYRAPYRPQGTAIELLSLERDMSRLSEMVAADKDALARSLDHQTLLTREVHHRVKNNLQIIASLLNIHSRSAETEEAAAAYRSIQRRVDALSVVHRNHFAELEDNEGIAVRPLVSELGAGLRGTNPTDPHMQISVKVVAAHVTQDIAVPIAFLITELGEIALLIDPSKPLSITIALREDRPGYARLILQSEALCKSEELNRLLDHRFGRVLTGLSRQLREPLEHDEATGRYCVSFPIIAEDTSE